LTWALTNDVENKAMYGGLQRSLTFVITDDSRYERRCTLPD